MPNVKEKHVIDAILISGVELDEILYFRRGPELINGDFYLHLNTILVSERHEHKFNGRKVRITIEDI